MNSERGDTAAPEHRRRAGLAIVVSLFGAAACGQAVETSTRRAPAERSEISATLGLWATEPEFCTSRVWSVTDRAVIKPDGSSCLVEGRTAGLGGWSGQASCSGGPPAQISLVVSASVPETLLISGDAIQGPLRLVRCAPLGAEQPVRDPHQPIEAAAEIDRMIATGADGVSGLELKNNALLSRAWMRGGELIKVVEPIVGGAAAPGERAYYYRNGGELFFVRDEAGLFAFSGGRLTTAYRPDGRIIADIEGSEVRETAAALQRQGNTVARVARAGPG